MRDAVDINTLSAAWNAIPAGQASVQEGATWLASNRSPILLVPSVIVPEEFATLINLHHPASSKISARVVRPFEYNRPLSAISVSRSPIRSNGVFLSVGRRCVPSRN
jgi:RES domain-containing protein